MPAQLPGDIRTLEYADVRITAPGLTGTVEVHRGTAPGARAAAEPLADLGDVFGRALMRERLTLEIRDQREAPATQAVPGERSTTRGEPAIELDVPAAGEGWGELVLAVAEDGVLTWHLPDPAPAPPPPVPGASAQDRDRGSGRTTFTLPRTVVDTPSSSQLQHRGVFAALGRKVFKVLAYRLADVAIGVAAEKAVGWWEERNRPHQLRSFLPGEQGLAGVGPLEPEQLRSLVGHRALLFVHGTASTIHGGYGRLPDDLLGRLHEVYGGRVLAFDHPTVATSPEANVRWFGDQVAAAIGPNASLDLDVVTHSRGGLVGRVLAERPDAAGLDADRLRVHRVVFGATPNAGTPLTNPDHIRDYLDTWSNILEFIPDNPVTSTLEVLLEVLKHVGASAVGGLDGLASMNPAGGWLADTLNGHGRAPQRPAIYHAITAEFEPGEHDGLARFARDRLTDHVFANAPNDLVVPTGGVFEHNGASGFPVEERVTFAPNRGIDHSSLWGQRETADALGRWLVG